MKTYNFDIIIDRKNTNSLKFDICDKLFGANNILPMWVADMDIESPDFVLDTLRQMIDHGVLGYSVKTSSFYEAVIGWFKRRYGWEITERQINCSPGVVASLCVAIQTFTEPGDKIIIQTPVYHPFYSIIEGNKRQVIKNSLVRNGDKYEIDFDDLEKKIDDKTKMFIFCSPHNPVGRVWTKEELNRIAELCIKHNILLISDEIHADIVYAPAKHIPIATLSDEIASRTLTCMAPSKTFNIAGLSTSLMIGTNSDLMNPYTDAINNLALHSGNMMGVAALESAYAQGDNWLDQLLEYLKLNLDYLRTFLAQNLPEVKLIEPEGTFLAWLDFSGLNLKPDEIKKILIEKAKVGLSDGRTFGKAGAGYQRLNFGCPKKVLIQGLSQIAKGFKE